MTACSDISPYGSLRATLGTKRTSASRRVRAPVLTCPLLIFFFSSFLALLSRLQPTLQAATQDDNTCPNHNPSCSRSFSPSSFLSPTPLVLRSQTKSYRHDATATRQPCALLYLILVFPYAHISLYSILSSAHPKPPLLYYRRHTLQVARVYIRPPSCSPRRALHHVSSSQSGVILFFPSLSLGDRLLSTQSQPISHAFGLSQLTPLHLSFSLTRPFL